MARGDECRMLIVWRDLSTSSWLIGESKARGLAKNVEENIGNGSSSLPPRTLST
jgi:hypothetical protein